MVYLHEIRGFPLGGPGSAYVAQLVLGCGGVVVVALALETRLPPV